MPRKPKKDTALLDQMMKDGLLKKASEPSFNLEWVPFGLPDLDLILGGGLPRNRISVLVGEESSGKSFLIQLLLKQAMESGLTCAYLDLERTFDPKWWAAVGIPLDDLLISQPPSGEKAIDVAVGLVRSKIDVLAIDSLAAMVPSFEVDNSAEQKSVGTQARLINEFLRKITVANTRTVVACVNQLRENIGSPGPVNNMPGGRGLRHFNSMTLRVRREGWLEEREKRVGFNMRVVLAKSKVGTPFGECLLPFYFRGEIDMLALMVERALEAGHIEQAGPWYKILGGENMMGKNTVLDALRADPDLIKRLEVLLGDNRID